MTSFNSEVEKHILDRLTRYTDQSVNTNQFLANVRYSFGKTHNGISNETEFTRSRNSDCFQGGFTPMYRDDYLRWINHLPLPGTVYVGMEDGSFAGFKRTLNKTTGQYREPGDSGYKLTTILEEGNTNDISTTYPENPEMNKHLKSCVNTNTGAPMDCVLQPGDPYIECINNCETVPCSQANFDGNDSENETDCTGLHQETNAACQQQDNEQTTIYCRNYTIKTVQEGEQLGYVPLTHFCHDVRGQFTQEQGQVVQVYNQHPLAYREDLYTVMSLDGTTSTVENLGNCYYKDGVTLVNRALDGSYAYCGGNNISCDDTFAGGFESTRFDPRFRPWYTKTKFHQQPLWLDPYPFYDSLGLGVTATHPIYDIVRQSTLNHDENSDKLIKVFAGVLAIDYRLEGINNFLHNSFGGSDNLVAIYEDKPPYYLIALSTGSPTTKRVLRADPTKPCPIEIQDADELTTRTECEPIRRTINNLTGTPEDMVLAIASQKLLNHFCQFNFTIPIRLASRRRKHRDDDEHSGLASTIWGSQCSIFEPQGAMNLRWRVIVASPGVWADSDSIVPGDAPLFGLMLFLGCFGFAICGTFLHLIYSKRKAQAVINSDWRFTCLFILGCALFSLSTLTLVGPNTDQLCMLRMWSFHMLLVMMLSPLFVKIWRIWKLVGSKGVVPRRQHISHLKTALLMLPFIGIQVIILLIISLVDPPRETHKDDIEEGIVTHHVACQHDTHALTIVELMYEGFLILFGCVLAYKQRNVDKKYGESQMLMFAMYNLASAAAFYLIVVSVAEVETNGRSFFRAIGVFWISVISSAAFVVPKLIRVHRDEVSFAKREKEKEILHAAYQVQQVERTVDTNVTPELRPSDEQAIPVQNC